MRRFRFVALAALALTCFVASGCVYLRLLTLRDQFKDFDNQVEVIRDPPLALRFKHPVLLEEDLDSLIGSAPTATATNGPATVRVYTFLHIGLPPENEPTDLDAPGATLSLTATIVKDKLTSIAFPPAVFNALDPRLAEAGLRSLARAEVDTVARTATATVVAQELPLPPDRAALQRIFGLPSFADLKDGQERWVYRYRLVPPAENAQGKPLIAAMAFVFKPNAGHPFRFAVQINGLWLSLGLPEAAASK